MGFGRPRTQFRAAAYKPPQVTSLDRSTQRRTTIAIERSGSASGLGFATCGHLQNLADSGSDGRTKGPHAHGLSMRAAGADYGAARIRGDLVVEPAGRGSPTPRHRLTRTARRGQRSRSQARFDSLWRAALNWSVARLGCTHPPVAFGEPPELLLEMTGFAARLTDGIGGRGSMFWRMRKIGSARPLGLNRHRPWEGGQSKS